jgi:Animal haem peroxidase
MSALESDNHYVRHGEELRGLGRFALDADGKDRAAPGEARFGRMFEGQPFRPPERLLVDLAEAMHEPTGAASLWKPYSRIPAGYIPFGQFMTHDLTYDRSPVSERSADPDGVRSFRSPRFDLDTIYAEPPYSEMTPPRDPNDRDKLRIDNLRDASKPDDLPRGTNGAALIPDPRNDGNLLICQLHLAFLKLHNRFVDDVRRNGVDGRPVPAGRVFDEARRLTRWHYQWLIVNDYLPRVVDRKTINEIRQFRDGRFRITTRHYNPRHSDRPMIPVELAVAALRFGHTMLGPTYAVRTPHQRVDVFGRDLTRPVLNGLRPIPPELEVRWDLFFNVPGAQHRPVNLARAFDSYLPKPLFELPPNILPPGDRQTLPFSLALRDLQRGAQYGLPSGQDVARTMQRKDRSVPVLSNRMIFRGSRLGDEPGWKEQAPLWFYILEEARELTGGEYLGPVGGRIVAEVVLKLLDLDRDSYLHARPVFRPVFLPARPVREATVGDLLQYAGVAASAAPRSRPYRSAS